MNLQEMLDYADSVGPQKREEFLRELEKRDPDAARELRACLRYRESTDPGSASPSCPPDTSSAEPPGRAYGLPEEIDGYRLLDAARVGGMAVVFRARHPTLHTDVALKFLGRSPWSIESRYRFAREVDALKKFNHPALVRVLGRGTWKAGAVETPYFVMDFVDGQHLDEHVRTNRLNEKEIASLFIQICHGVEHAHSKGVLHRDLKPSNILVQRSDGRPVIVDFGIARIRDERSLTATGTPRGTLAYMSPEQLGGNQEVSVRTDIFSLGVVLYELLCGQLPKDWTQSHVIDTDLIMRRPGRFGSADVIARADLTKIVQCAVEPRRADRFRNVAVMRDQLERVVRGEGVRIDASSRGTRHWLRAALSIASIVLALLIAWWATTQSDLAELFAEGQRRATHDPLVAGPSAVTTDDVFARIRDGSVSYAEAMRAARSDLLAGLHRRFEDPEQALPCQPSVLQRALDELEVRGELPMPELVPAELGQRIADARAARRSQLAELSKSLELRPGYYTDEAHRAVLRELQEHTSGPDGLFERMLALPSPTAPPSLASLGRSDGLWMRDASGLQWRGPAGSVGTLVFGDPKWTNYDYRAWITLATIHARELEVLAAVSDSNCWALNIGKSADGACELRAWTKDEPLLSSASNRSGTVGRRMLAGDRVLVELRVRDHSIEVYCDGELLFSSWHRALSAGQVGVSVRGGSVLEYFEVRTPTGVPLWKGLPTPDGAVVNQGDALPGDPFAWCTVLEEDPDPSVVRNPKLLKQLEELDLPWRVRDRTTGIEMLLVPPGTYERGASSDDRWAEPHERPMHRVTITKPYYLGRYEVQVSEWNHVMISERSNDGVLGRFPKHGPTAPTLREFLARCTGLRLPTEAEWEYACRAGTVGSTYGDLPDIAWCPSNAGGGAHLVGAKEANDLGFHDMLGNVWEVCSDRWGDVYPSLRNGATDPVGPLDGPGLVIRGGSYNSRYRDDQCRASIRGAQLDTDPAFRTRGFRVARSP